MKAIAIDDEPLALEVIKSHSSKLDYLDLTRTFTDAFKALEYLQRERVDLIFLDIKMPDISGIDFFKSLSQKPLVIFTTAYTEHAVISYELDAVDYLLKPFSLARFIKSCNKANSLLSFNTSKEPVDYIFVKDGYEQHKINISDILYLEAAGNYVTFSLIQRKVLPRSTLQEAMDYLSSDQFVRVHRSYIVSLSKIDKVERHQVTINGVKIPIGSAYKKDLFKIFNKS